jgi:hypothetical protein
MKVGDFSCVSLKWSVDVNYESDCHEFWTEFRAKEVSFFDSHGLGFAVATELPADLPVELPG